jgi:hypothetical protein
VQPAIVMIPLIISMVAGGGFIVNEWSHGGLSEGMGMGHHHLLDHGRGHCLDENMTHEAGLMAHDGASMHGSGRCGDANGPMEAM